MKHTSKLAWVGEKTLILSLSCTLDLQNLLLAIAKPCSCNSQSMECCFSLISSLLSESCSPLFHTLVCLVRFQLMSWIDFQHLVSLLFCLANWSFTFLHLHCCCWCCLDSDTTRCGATVALNAGAVPCPCSLTCVRRRTQVSAARTIGKWILCAFPGDVPIALRPVGTLFRVISNLLIQFCNYQRSQKIGDRQMYLFTQEKRDASIKLLYKACFETEEKWRNSIGLESYRKFSIKPLSTFCRRINPIKFLWNCLFHKDLMEFYQEIEPHETFMSLSLIEFLCFSCALSKHSILQFSVFVRSIGIKILGHLIPMFSCFYVSRILISKETLIFQRLWVEMKNNPTQVVLRSNTSPPFY
jgi:hypothetical protein